MPHSNYSESQKTALRSWLKLLGTSNRMRKRLQARLMENHGISLSRFDILANLYRAPLGGVRLGDLSKRLMVTNGNVTQVMAPLVKDGLVLRQTSKSDARVSTVQLSAKGLRVFEKMAADHAAWVEELFHGLAETDQQTLARILGLVNKEDD